MITLGIYPDHQAPPLGLFPHKYCTVCLPAAVFFCGWVRMCDWHVFQISVAAARWLNVTNSSSMAGRKEAIIMCDRSSMLSVFGSLALLRGEWLNSFKQEPFTRKRVGSAANGKPDLTLLFFLSTVF